MRWLLALPALVLILSGCATQRSITGTWKGTANDTSFTQVFNADNTFDSSVAADIAGTTFTTTISGTYNLNGDQLETTPKSIKVTGLRPQDNRAAEEKFMKEGNLKPTKSTVKFVGDDEITLTNGKFSVDLKRQK